MVIFTSQAGILIFVLMETAIVDAVLLGSRIWFHRTHKVLLPEVHKGISWLVWRAIIGVTVINLIIAVLVLYLGASGFLMF